MATFSTLRTAAITMCLLASAVIFDRVALADGGGLDSQSCEFELSNGAELTVPCDSCGGEDYRGNACESDPAATTCERICDANGNVLSGRCRCICPEIGMAYYTGYGFEANCPVNP